MKTGHIDCCNLWSNENGLTQSAWKILVNPIEMEKGGVQICLEGLAQVANMAIVPQVTHGITGLLPDVLLWIQVGTPWREVQQLQVRMCVDERPCRTFVPGRAIPQEQNPPSRQATDHVFQKVDGMLGIQARKR
jgi:hypothetical protein